MTRSSVDAPGIITEEMAKAHVSGVLTALKAVQLRPDSTGEITFKKMVTLSRARVTEGSLHRWSSGGALILDKNLPDLGKVFEGVRAEYKRHHRGVADGDLPRVLQPATFTELDKIVRGARKAERRQAEKRKAQKGRELAYPGLAAYDGSMATWFCGRDDDVTQMIARLDDTYRSDCPTPIPLVAVSGTGKSSYLAAGVAPAIRGRGIPSAPEVKDWAILTITPGSDPVTNLLRAVPALSAAAKAPELDRGAVHAALAEHAAPGVVLFVDQAEEMFQSEVPAAERRRFGELLAALADVPHPDSTPSALVVVSLRADFLHRLGDIPALRDARHHVEYLEHLTEAQLRAVITEPARRAGFRVSEDLVSRILADAQVAARGSDDGQLPLIAHVLHLMNNRKRFSLACYEELGGLDGAVRKTADSVWEKIRTAGLADTATELLLRLVHVGDGPEHDTRRRVPLDDLLAGPHAARTRRVINIFSGPTARLILVEDRGGRVEVTIVHESLLRLWQQLRRAVDNERDDLRAHRKIEDRASDWDGAGRHRDDLDRGGRLREAHRIVNRWPAESGITTEFIRESDRNERRRKALTAGLMVLICALFVALSGALYQQHLANKDLVFTNVVRAADGLRDQDPSLAAQLYLYGYRLRPTPELYTDLLSTQSAALSSPLHPDHGTVRSVAFTPNGAAAIVGSADGTVQMWDVRDRATMHPWGPPLPGTGRDTKSVAVTPDGRTVIAGDASGVIRMWDVTSLSHPVPLIPPRAGLAAPPRTHLLFAGVLSLAITPDGHQLLFGGSDGSIHRWDITNPHDPKELEPPLEGEGAVTSLSLSKDGRTLAAGRTDHTLELVDLRDPRHLRLVAPPMPVGDKPIYALAFSPTNPVLATAGADGLVRLWDTDDLDHLAPLGVPLPGAVNNAVYGLAFSPNGNMLASAGADNRIRVWNVSNANDAHLIGSPLSGHTRGVAAVAFSPDDQTLISGSADNSARVWTLPDILVGNRAAVSDVTLSADGNTVVSADQDGTSRAWTIRGPVAAALGPPTLVDPAGVVTVALSPDGATMATGSVTGTLQLWRDPARPKPLGPPLIAHGKPIYGLSFSADGNVLASAGADNVVHLWTIGATGGAAAGTFSPDGRTHPSTSAPDGVGAVRFWPTGRVLAVGSPDFTVGLWDASDPYRPQQLGHTTPHTAFVKAIAISPDGTTLATGSADHTISVFDVRDLRHPQPWGRAPVKHRNPVTSLTFNGDGKKLISGGDDGQVIVWNLRNHAPTPIGDPLRFSSSPVRAVTASPNRDLVASGGRDALVEIWSTDVQQAIHRICEATPNTLMPKLWPTYVTATDYDPPCP